MIELVEKEINQIIGDNPVNSPIEFGMDPVFMETQRSTN